MGEFKRSNKICGIRWLKKDVKDVKIKIKITPQDGIISLPKFEDYTQRSETLNLETSTEEYFISWQQKLFSLWEVKRYSETHNCITDNEIKYHEMVENLENPPSKIFTYTNDDGYLPFPLQHKKKDISNLSSYFEKLSMNEGVARLLKGDTSSDSHLFRSEDDISLEEEWIAMHVMFDTSEYVEGSELIFKQEEVLLSLYYNTTHKYLILNPEVNDLELNPYTVDAMSGGRCYQYSVDVQFNNCTSENEEIVALLRKLHRKWEKKQKHLFNFVMPPPDKKVYYVVLEILTAKGFDMDNLYVDFEIKVPDDMHCNEKLKGKTHTSEARFNSNGREWVFGHIVEFNLEMQSGIETEPLKLFLEVISRDWWNRHRTEGYSYFPLPLNPGRYSEELCCTRAQETGVEGESRRHFVGGCHLIRDLNVLAEPHLYETNFTFTPTGTITIQWQIIKQQCLGMPRTPIRTTGSSTASALLLGAETAISRYKKARSKLAHATRQVAEDRSEVFGDG